jgi:hypothetical protein
MGTWGWWLVAIALAGLPAVGCGGGGDGNGVATDPTPEEPTAETAECTNEASGYRVEYPADWHTNDGGAGEPCSFFDPEPVEVPEATEFFDVAVIVSREPVTLDVIAGEDPSRTVLEREETQIAGGRALRMEIEATGQGLLDRGTRSYQVVVDVDGESLIVSTFAVGDLDYGRNKEIVDQMADSLELIG